MVVDFDPNIFTLGPIQVRWYGAMYVIGFMLANFLLKKLSERGFFKVPKEKVDSLITICFICMFLGARFAYVFIYNWGYYKNHLTELLSVWQGGLSFHGAIAGLSVGAYIFAKKNKISWSQVLDNMVLAGTPGLFFGRMGNFINGELYGSITDSSFGMIFPAGGPYPRHPSQLYEGITEGILLSIILWLLLKKVRYYGVLASVFLIGYGTFRFFVEFVREPDVQLGKVNGLNMGQWLCSIMVIVGITALINVLRKKREN